MQITPHLELEGTLYLSDESIQMFFNIGNGDVVRGVQKVLETQYGEGSLDTLLNSDGRKLAYTFKPVDASRMITPDLIEAMYQGRVALCNSSKIKLMPDGTYAPVEEGDVYAIEKLVHINRLEAFLKHHGKGTKVGT